MGHILVQNKVQIGWWVQCHYGFSEKIRFKKLHHPIIIYKAKGIRLL